MFLWLPDCPVSDSCGFVFVSSEEFSGLIHWNRQEVHSVVAKSEPQALDME